MYDFYSSSTLRQLYRSPFFISFFLFLFCFCDKNYVAPEVIKGEYRPAPADMWSLGVVAYVLMSGKLPFDGDSTELIKRNILGEHEAARLGEVDGRRSMINDQVLPGMRGQSMVQILCMACVLMSTSPPAAPASSSSYERCGQPEAREHSNAAPLPRLLPKTFFRKFRSDSWL